MSLPLAFGTTLDTIPAAAGYLQAEPHRISAWHACLPTGPRVGLTWAGNPQHSNDRRRTIPAAALAPLLAVPGLTCVSLQYGQAMAGLPDLTPRLTDFAATAALITCLDLVITVDTAVAHLAGALGVPTWIILPHASDWRWMAAREDSAWYDSVRLFRQTRPGEWAGVVSRVVNAVSETFLPLVAKRIGKVPIQSEDGILHQ
jgi:hypothetical protein